MKNLITSIACVMVLLAMLAEFAHGQALYSRIMAADQAVNSFRDVARAEGCISGKTKGGSKRSWPACWTAARQMYRSADRHSQ